MAPTVLLWQMVMCTEDSLLKSEERQLHVIILIGSILAVVAACIVSVPREGMSSRAVIGSVSIPSACVFRNITGIPCAGCGIVRSVVCLAHCEVARSWGFHRLGMVVLVLLVAQIPYRAATLIRGRSPKCMRHKSIDVLWIGLALAAAINWVFTLIQLR